MKKTLLSLSISICFISLFGFAYSSTTNEFVGCLKEKGVADIYHENETLFANILDARIKNRRFERNTTNKPILILAPTQEAQVSSIVTCATRNKIQLRIRSGGHDYEGASYVAKHEFVILDMFNLSSIHVDVRNETACVGAGALLGEVYYQIWYQSRQVNKSLVFPAGVCPTVAVGGHFSGGGYGNMLRRYGLSIDNMICAKIVIANGSIVTTSGEEDLFWAIRGGGGGSFGVILSYTIQLVTIEGNVTYFHVERFANKNASRILYHYQKSVLKWDMNLFIRVLLQPVTLEGSKEKTLRTTYIGLYIGNTESLIKEVGDNFPLLGLKATDCEEMSWIDSVLRWANFDNTSKPDALRNMTSDEVVYLKRKSDYVKSAISIPDLDEIFRNMTPGKVGMVFNSYGGEMERIPENATAFPHRQGNIFKIQYSANWKNTSIDAETEYLKQIRSLYMNMTKHVSSKPRESYLNYKDLDIGTNKGHNNVTLAAETYGTSYFKDNFGKLVRIKTVFDPHNFFRHEQSIPTLNNRS